MSDSDKLAGLGSPDAPPGIPAATLVIFRRDPAGGPAQVLMVERSASMVFAGGAAVFPGGRIDPADHELAARLAGDDAGADRQDLAARIAAVRETLEETGLAVGFAGAITSQEARSARALLLDQGALAPVLDQLGWRLELERLIPWARWHPRHLHARVFDTRFYLIDIGTGAVDVEIDATENTHLFWASAAEALRLADEGRIQVIFPTRRNLERLAQFSDFASAAAHARAVPPVTITPRIETRDGEPWLIIPDEAGYPVTAERIDSAMRG